jgi:hypothetical protein
MISDTRLPGTDQRGRWALIPLVVALLVVGTVWIRYENPWAENDTAVLTLAARAVLDEGTIAPSRYAYDHGFGYPSFLATLSTITGLSTHQVQVIMLPWLTVFTALAAFIAFRAVTRSARAGAVAASLLLIQPDFLFVNQRGSHEKMTWTFVLTLIFCLAVSLEGSRVRKVAPLVVTFYLCGFAMLTTNAFFGSSFTTIVLLSVVGGVLVTRRLFRFELSRRVVPRLGYVFLVLTALTYVIVFYIYAPAGNNVANLGRVVDRLASLYLNVDTHVETRVTEAAQVSSNASVSRSATTTSPYASVTLGWTSTLTFVLLTLFTWLMMASAFICWLILAVTFVRRGVARSDLALFLVWAFTASAAIQIALSVGSDFAGVLGSNLQLRLFPVFNVFAIPLIVGTVSGYSIPRRSKLLRNVAMIGGLAIPIVAGVAYPPATILLAVALGLLFYIVPNWERSVSARRLTAVVGACLFVYFTGAAVLKATNDPLVSSKWTFYDGNEAQAIQWANENLANQVIWADIDERVRTASILELGDDGSSAALWTTRRSPSVRYVLQSEVIEARAKRTSSILPTSVETDQIYDNGSANVWHYLPSTPYQP